MIRDIFGHGHCPLVLLSRDRKKQAFGKYDFSIEFTLMFELTHFSPMFLFYIPRTRRKTFGVLIFSRAIEMENLAKIGYGKEKI